MAHILSTLLVLMALLGVLVVFHELGHFISAKLLRMKVHEFAFGFGPIIARLFKRGDTEFNIRSVPLGGFVRIAGMEPEEEDVEGGFNAAPIWHRAVVVLSGPFMSLLLGYIVFIMIGLVWGFPTGRITIDSVQKGSAAASSHIRPGDVIYSLNGKQLDVNDTEQFMRTVYGSPGKELKLNVIRKGRNITYRIAPVLSDNPSYEKLKEQIKKNPKLERDPLYQKKIGLLGVTMGSEVARKGLVASVEEGTTRTIFVVWDILNTIFSHKIKENVGGIVAIGYMTGQMVKAGVDKVFLELAALSLMLGIINLIPWPILDGGHILYLIVEKIRGKKLEPDRWYIVQTFGLAVLVFLAVFLIYFDFARILAHKLP